jgi:flavin-dependent dehydrogenase
LARAGAQVTVFDASHPREKPCGGGLTPRAQALLPVAPEDDPLTLRRHVEVAFDSSEAKRPLTVSLARPLAIAARAELDAWLLRRARDAGAALIAQRVVHVSAAGAVTTTAGAAGPFDMIVGADGARSLVRRTFLGPLPLGRLTLGWFARGPAPLAVRFVPAVQGYLWLFPRTDHVSVGLGAPLGLVPTSVLKDRLRDEVARTWPALSADIRWYAHLIPTPSTDPASVLENAGDRWALIGDAAALADPITGEGIRSALVSARLLAEALTHGWSPRSYTQRLLEVVGRELVQAARWRSRFYQADAIAHLLAYSARSDAIRQVLGDLVSGEQGYLGLKGRLLRAAPSLAWARLTHLGGWRPGSARQ